MLTEVNIQKLGELCEKQQVLWVSDGGEWHTITAVSDGPIDIEEDGMPIPVAYLQSGGYIDLENVDPRSLFVATPAMNLISEGENA
jgi:hypothetical protein